MTGHRQKQTLWSTQRGFTIVELLIVIIVIAILAAIVIVAYNNVTARANASAAQSAASDLAKLLSIANTNNGTYPNDLSTVNNGGPMPSGSTSYAYHPGSGNSSYCATITTGQSSYKITDTATTPTSGGCPGDGVGGVAAITNLALNPSVEGGITHWAAWIPNASGSTSQVSTGGFSGSSFYRISYSTTSTANTGGIYYGDIGEMPVQPGTAYTLSGYVRVNNPRPMSAYIEWYNNVPSMITSNVSATTTIPANTWTRLSVTATAPAGATWARLTLYINGAAWQAGDTLDGDGIMATSGSTLYNYADGSSPNWIWNGTANNSMSTGPPQ